MAPKLYMIDQCPPVRSVLLTAKALGLTLDLVRIDLAKDEHLDPSYLKLNPQHTLPTIDDDGFVLWDSHAINVYLVQKYGKNDFLYPKDLQKQAVINQRLHFDSGILFAAGLQVIRSIIREGAKEVPAEKAEFIKEAYGFLEKFLEGNKWMAGDSVTLADLHFIPSLTSISVLVPIDADKFPNVTAWLERAQNLPYYDANLPGLNIFKRMISSILNS